MDLEDIRLKEPNELKDEEKTFLKDNWGELTDDEKGIFKDVNVEEKKEEEEKKFEFSSQEDFDKAVTARTEQILADKEKARKEEEEREKQGKEKEEERFFPEGYQAKDWDEAAKSMYPKFRERMFKEQEEVRRQTQDTIDKINQEFDEEIEILAKEDTTIPAKGTKEREAFETELSQIGVEYQGVTNMTQAYKIWKALNPGTKKEEEVTTKQRNLASKVGRSSGEGTQVKERSYAKLSGSNMDSLIEEELAKLGVKE